MPNYNFPAFEKKKFELNQEYIDVWNPAEHEPDKTDAMWSEYLAQDIIDIEENCDSILMFGQWYRSAGAYIELITAHRLGLEIIIEQKWLRWIPSILNLLLDVKNKAGNTYSNDVTKREEV